MVKNKEIKKALAKAATKRRKVKEALTKASQWESYLTERQRTEIPYSQARKEVVSKIYNKLIKYLL